jgi:hypothetical protein
VALGLALALAVVGCSVGGGAVSSSSGVTSVSSGGTIVIGTTLSLTGSLGVLGLWPRC